MQVNIHEAKTHLSRLLNRVICGEEVIISKAGKPLAKLVPFDKPRKRRVPGRDHKLGKIARDFNAPLPNEILEAFER
ncbi:MAG: type II toxin-antitoxin system Phd/YefM family antitoxin [Acidobacteria bacterium]|nr:type II toxin-antitoxin system Phd/YefM family antitoxin [Acidobacteriota bacterium]MCI0625612.1 type II toxin-antitoxin system Phd/YefM family antitoxin [Acidobacteriota bacterium]MCI0721355.1 type II toxin-antitoxin system Phd/YefM family antitoxin [Acidobacteriota bacterium]